MAQEKRMGTTRKRTGRADAVEKERRETKNEEDTLL